MKNKKLITITFIVFSIKYEKDDNIFSELFYDKKKYNNSLSEID